MGRKFLPALRGSYETTAVDDTDEVEGKSLTITGVRGAAFTSTTRLGTSIYGTEGRADAWDMDAVITEGYERAIWVYRCVELISGDLSRLRFKAARNRGTEQEEVLESHPLYRVLNKRANPLEKAKPFKKRLVAQLLLSKRGVFVEVIKSRAGNIVRLDLLDPSRCRPIPDEDGDDYIKHFEFIRRNGTVREIPTQHVRWIRQPHPTDPFSGTTPLEAAGLSVELDFLSRLYNSQFIKNDARPGGVLGVDTDSLTDQEMERLERKFQPGAQNAGALTVIGTGPGGATYVDTTSKPRDMQYSETSRNSKVEILAAFGIGESMLGNASERAFENADAELYSYWTQVLPTYMELVADAFEEDLPDEWEPYLDTSQIEVLQLPLRRDREEARTEVNQGLRSIDEYRHLAKLPELANAQTRALWVSPAKAPIPGRPEDAAALGLGDPSAGVGGDMGGGGMPPPEGDPGGMPPDGGQGGQPGGDAAAAVAELEQVIAEGGAPAGPDDTLAPDADAESIDPADWQITPEDIAAAETTEGDAAAAVDAGQPLNTDYAIGDGAAAVAAAQQPTGGLAEGDAAEAVRRAQLEGKAIEVDADHGAIDAAAMAVKAALDATLARQVGVITARLESPKTRKGTKFWTPESPTDTRAGDEPIDAAKVVDAARWEDETVQTILPLATQAATAGAEHMLGTLTDAGVLVGGGNPADVAPSVAAPAVLPAAAEAGAAVRGFLTDVEATIASAAETKSSMAEIVAEVKGLYLERAATLTAQTGRKVAQAAVADARDAAVEALVPMNLEARIRRGEGSAPIPSYEVPAGALLLAPPA